MRILPELARSHAKELLDGEIADLGALADNLRDLRAVDRLLGNTALTWRYLLPMLRELPREARPTLLDVATGGADGPRRIAALARRQGYDLRVVATDRLAQALRLARAAGGDIALVRHDARALPFGDGAVDFVMCSLALHHFDRDAAVVLLRELGRAARRGVIVTDLRRGRAAYWCARLFSLGPWHAMARHDGPLSTLRAYTLAEARALARDAGLAHARVVAHAPFRFVISLRRSE